MERLEKEARALLKAHGTFVRRTKHSDLFEVGAERVSLPITPSDVRAWSNTLADIKRAIRDKEKSMITSTENQATQAVAKSPVVPIEVGPVKIIREQSFAVHVGQVELRRLLQAAGIKTPQDSKISFCDDGYAVITWTEITEEER